MAARGRLLLLLVVTAFACADYPPPALASSGAALSRREARGVEATQLPRSELFTFHSDVFVNFHHFLYRLGQAGPGADTASLDARIRVRPEDLESLRKMKASDRERWDVPVAAYRLGLVGRDLLFDGGMVALRDCLVMAGNFCDRLSPQDQGTVEMLGEHVGLYRRAFWDRHDRANRAWIAATMPLAQRFESEIAPQVSAAYTGEWPDSRNRVDVAYYANAVGGYTTADGHITVSSVDPDNQGYLGLELLFHEASHGDTMERPLRRLIRRSFDAIEAETPPDLWHMTIFYTAAYVTRAVLAEAGIDYPQTYAEVAGIFERSDANARAKAALDAHWRAALEAGDGFEEAMAGVARAWVGDVLPSTLSISFVSAVPHRLVDDDPVTGPTADRTGLGVTLLHVELPHSPLASAVSPSRAVNAAR